jgi:hypothetical protein
MEYRSLGELATANDAVRKLLESSLSHTETAKAINVLPWPEHWEFETSEASVRRYRKTLTDPLDDDVTDVDPTWAGFSEADRENLHTKLDSTLDSVNADPSMVSGLRVSQYQTISKDGTGQAHVHDLYAVRLLVRTRETEPEWPLVSQAPPTVVNVTGGSGQHRLDPEWQTAVILPDIQAGYYLDPAGVAFPTHDEAAIEIALQVIADTQPGLTLIGGDGLDFPELGKYRLSPAFARTTQAALDWTETFVATIRALAPETETVWLAGNHEERLPNYLLDNARAAYGLRIANAPESWPVLSVPFLCRFPEHGVTYLPGYPASEFWINDRLVAFHGRRVNSSGSTVHKYLAEERASTISFHIHRREYGERTRHTRSGPQTIMAASPGALCRTDGAVPSTKGGTDLDGVPLTRSEDWQLGLAVVYYKPGDGDFVYEQIAINTDGPRRWAMYHNRLYEAGASR